MTKTKRCPQCGEEKPLTNEHWSPRKRDIETGEILRWAGWCRICHSAKMRERRQNWTEEQKEQRRAYIREQYRLDMKDPAKRAARNAQERERRKKAGRRELVQAAQRRWYERLRADPERWADYLEGRRISYRLLQERKTGQLEGQRRVRKGTHKPWVAAGRGSAKNVEPLAIWLETVLKQDHRDLDELAQIFDVDERVLYRIRHREQPNTTLALADHLMWRYRRPVQMPRDHEIEAYLAARCRDMPGNGTRLLRYLDLAEHVAHLGGAVVERVDDLWPEVKA